MIFGALSRRLIVCFAGCASLLCASQMALAGEFMVEVTPPNGGNTVSATTTSGGTISGIMPTGQLFTINVYTNGLSSTPGPLTCYANGSQIFSSTSEEEGINSQDQFTWQTSTAGTYNIYCKFTAYEVNLTTQNIVVTVGPPASTPVFSPAAGTYTSPQTVAISDATSGAYTTSLGVSTCYRRNLPCYRSQQQDTLQNTWTGGWYGRHI